MRKLISVGWLRWAWLFRHPHRWGRILFAQDGQGRGQDLLGHSDLETTKVYLHSTRKTIRDIGMKISEVMEGRGDEGKIIEFKVS